jgi:hypothetical protein
MTPLGIEDRESRLPVLGMGDQVEETRRTIRRGCDPRIDLRLQEKIPQIRHFAQVPSGEDAELLGLVLIFG